MKAFFKLLKITLVSRARMVDIYRKYNLPLAALRAYPVTFPNIAVIETVNELRVINWLY